MKKALSLLLALTMVFAPGSLHDHQRSRHHFRHQTGGHQVHHPAADTKPADTTPAASTEGKVFNIYAWNEEFKGFFEKYYKGPRRRDRELDHHPQ